MENFMENFSSTENFCFVSVILLLVCFIVSNFIEWQSVTYLKAKTLLCICDLTVFVKKEQYNFRYCSSFQPIVLRNRNRKYKVKSKILFQCCSEITWPTVDIIAFIYLIRKGKYNWFLHEEPLLDLLLFLLYLVQSICCFKYNVKIINLSILILFFYSLNARKFWNCGVIKP